MNITTSAVKDDLDVLNWGHRTSYVWVDYSSEAQFLELRTSVYKDQRPFYSQLNLTAVNLSDSVEEYMWAGFSSGTRNYWTNDDVGDWTFESHLNPRTIPSNPPTTSSRRSRT